MKQAAELLRRSPLPIAALIALAIGGVVSVVAGAELARAVWLASLAVVGFPVVWRTLLEVRRGHFATDVVATAAIVGALILGHPFAGLVIVLMQTGGEALEHFAAGRAARALHELERAAPRLAHRVVDGVVEDIPVDLLAPGDTLLIRPGELIPSDGVVIGGQSDVDVSRLTGEPMPVAARAATQLMSGSLNGSGTLTVRATARAAESQYARIVGLVRRAQESKAPLQRLAERYAVWFTPLTAAACVTTWAITRDWSRVLAVLVVATPCPLILAPPIAIVGGINRAARRGILVRHGGALERLGAATVAVFDKTGTLTIGKPAIAAVHVFDGVPASRVLQLAAAVEAGSSHLLARVISEAAAGLPSLSPASELRESAGRGVIGVVDGHEVAVGGRGFLRECYPRTAASVEAVSPALQAVVAVDGTPVGTIEFADRPRHNARSVLERLGRLGIERTLLMSGDDSAIAMDVAREVGITEARGDMLPADKSSLVSVLKRDGEVVAMIGDGINDAPAMATADIGLAMAAHGAGITAEAADVIVLVDDLDRVADAVQIARTTTRLAHQSIWAGLLLSAGAMVVAAAGMLPPTAGALLQEGIDLAVIANALRASRA